MRRLISTLLLLHGASACISSSPRAFSVPNYAPVGTGQFPVGTGFAQPVAAGVAPIQGPVIGPVAAGDSVLSVPQPIAGGAGVARQSSVLEYLLGNRITLAEFSADGYNAEGGGPINSGAALSCRVDGTPCCWANVPPPDDQLDWQIATGSPDAPHFQNVPAPEGSYLVAYARGAAPSDEAQFASCSIACASSPITVRAKHWQSENVLLQVCQRESFPASASFNPLLNCQEFPLVNGLSTTEVVLPKASLIDIVFVASNFVGENGDMAILDDIELSYDRNGEECQQQQTQTVDESSDADNSIEQEGERTQGAHRLTLETNAKSETASLGQGGDVLKARFHNMKSDFGAPTAEFKNAQGASELVNERFVQGSGVGFRQPSGGAAAPNFGVPTTSGGAASASAANAGESSFVTGEGEDLDEEERSFFGHRAAGEATFKETVKGPTGKIRVPSTEDADSTKSEPEPLNPAKPPCPATSCTFENGTTCHYQDAHQTQSIRGLTTRFQVVTGQFMNKITGVKSGLDGHFYAATFLFPREMAGLEASTEPLPSESRIRFHYYESTHGVQLKACCGTIDECPFQSDKFVSVDDRVWKTGSLSCGEGTEKVIFICENTRTNQGACAIDDIQMVRPGGDVHSAQALC